MTELLFVREVSASTCAVLLVVSMGCEVSEGAVSCTWIACGIPCGFKMIEILGAELTATGMREPASANPGATTVTRYCPGARSSKRKSPSASVVVERRNDDSSRSIDTLAPATRAPLASSTVPTKAPPGLCATAAIPQSSKAYKRRRTITADRPAFCDAIHASRGLSELSQTRQALFEKGDGTQIGRGDHWSAHPTSRNRI